ncbi:MAG: hypothetical protein ACK46Q_12780 [Hyphomonas sp.]
MIDTSRSGGAAMAVFTALGNGTGRTLEELMSDLGLERRQAVNAAQNLRQRQYLTAAPGGVLCLTETGQAALAAGEKISGSRQKTVRAIRDTFRERAWRSMRIRRRFTVGELVSDAARDDDAQPHDNARRYLARLAAAGFVKELPGRTASHAPGSNGHKRYMLIRNNGPKAPIWRAEANVVHDFNTGEDVPCSRP